MTRDEKLAQLEAEARRPVPPYIHPDPRLRHLRRAIWLIGQVCMEHDTREPERQEDAA